MNDISFISLFDAHIGWDYKYSALTGWKKTPAFDKSLIRRTLEFVADFKPNYVILGGDQLHLDMISSYRKFSTIVKKERAIEEEYELFDKLLLTPLLKLVNNVVWLTGNHEARVGALLEQQPELSGLIEPVKSLGLDIKCTKIVEQGGLFNLGKLYFTHGDNVPSGYVAKNAALRYLRNIRFGHFHTYSAYTLFSASDPKDVKTSICVPALAAFNPSYMKNGPSQNLQGFNYGFISRGGNFTDYIVINSDGFTINGKFYF